MTITAALDAGESAQRRKRLARLLREKARSSKTVLAPSPAQRGVWYMQQRDPGSHAYHVAFCVRVLSAIDADAAREALQLLVDRHAMLRATFHHRGEDLEIEVRGAADPEFVEADAQGVDDDRLHEMVKRSLARPFDLTEGPLIRMTLFSRADEDHVLLLVIHHLVCDGWSLGVLLQEFIELYESERSNRPSRLPPHGIDFDHFITWQQSWLTGPAGEASRAYWLDRLGGELPELSLPGTQTRRIDAPHGQQVVYVTTGTELHRELNRVAQACGVTMFCLLLAAYELFVMRVSGHDDIVVGVPMAGRSEPGYEGVVGHFVNLVAIRGQIEGNPSFQDFTARVWTDLQQAIEHQAFPFSELVRLLRPAGQAPIFRTHLNILKPSVASPIYDVLAPAIEPLAWGSLKLLAFDVEAVEESYDLAFRIIEIADDLNVKIQYDTAILTADAVHHLWACFIELLRAIVADPGCGVRQLNLIPPAMRTEMLEGWNATARPLDAPAMVAAMLEAQVDRTPDAIALVVDEQALSYGELERRSNRVANILAARDLGPGDVVAICAERSVALVTAIIGALKAGVAYVPVDPRYPQDRIEFVLNDCQARLVLMTPAVEPSLPTIDIPRLRIDAESGEPDPRFDQRLPSRGEPEDLAYVIYTSGSTGRPKGVQISNHALFNFVTAMQDRLPIGAGDALLSVTTPSFDIFGLELFLPLATGARIELASDQETKDGKRLATRIADRAVTFMQATPSTWRLLLASGFVNTGAFTGLCGGEALDPSLARQMLAANIDLWNMYGPTETTIWSCMERVRDVDGSTVSIGRPIANTQAYVLDHWLELVPIGTVGKLYLGGSGLARGYLNRPELTVEKFVPSPFSKGKSARLYDTGDLSRYLSDGRLECVGREDQQVKIRGYRIELEEIESVLATHPEIQQAVAAVEGARTENARLIAFVLKRPGAEPIDSRDLRAWMRTSLPDYMLPSDIVQVDAFPQTPNGKVDRQALLRMQDRPKDQPKPLTHQQDQADRALLASEQFLLEIWQALLGTDAITIDDNFFEIGGHSLLAAKMIAQLEGYHHRTLSIALLVEAPTIRQLARLIEELPSLEPGPCLFTFKEGDGSPPVVLMPSLAGTALHWRQFVTAFGSERAFVGIYVAGEPDYDKDVGLEDFALDCAKRIAEAFPLGHCHLLGYSFGGTLAFEVARQLKIIGFEVGVTAVLDRAPTSADDFRPSIFQVARNLFSRMGQALGGGTIAQKARTLSWLLRIARKRAGGRDAVMQEYILGAGDIPERSRRLVSWFTRMETRYRPALYHGKLLIIRASKRPLWGPFEHDLGWSRYADGEVTVEILDGGHSQMLEPDQMPRIIELLSKRFEKSEASVGS